MKLQTYSFPALAGLACTAVAYFYFSVNFWAAFLLGTIIFSVSFFIHLISQFDSARMNYSETASASLQRLAREIEERLRNESSGISKVAGTWIYGYPKIFILFTSTEALEQINSTDLLTQLSDEVAATIHADSTFGPNRMTFDSKQAILAITDSKGWSYWFPEET